MDGKALMPYAVKVMENSYSPYSNFPVGAAILMRDGKIVTGVNVENASFGATNCAERSAIFAAISMGYKRGDITAIAVTGKTEDFLPPCCLCRQVMVELCSPEIPVYLRNGRNDIKEVSLKELVPYAFTELDI